MAKINKIVVAYDSSESSQKALDWALQLVRATQASLDVVMVLAPVAVSVDFTGAYIVPEARELAEEEMTQKLAEVEKFCARQQVTVTTRSLFGNAVDEILQYAEEVHADLLVCGTRGLGGFQRLLLGSVAHRLVTYAKIPVLVAK